MIYPNEEKSSREVEIKTVSSLEKIIEGISIAIAVTSFAYLAYSVINYFSYHQ